MFVHLSENSTKLLPQQTEQLCDNILPALVLLNQDKDKVLLVMIYVHTLVSHFFNFI